MATFKELVGVATKRDPSSISDDATPATLPGWDSLSHVLMVSLFEEKYGVMFSAEEIGAVKSLFDFRRLLIEKGATIE
jgi:acyl carrier protein